MITELSEREYKELTDAAEDRLLMLFCVIQFLIFTLQSLVLQIEEKSFFGH